jgi:hypothetical protein
LNEFNNTVFDQISNSYKKLPEPMPEPTPLPEPSIDSITTPSSSVESTTDEEDLVTPTSHSDKYEEEETDGDYDDHESSSIATVRKFNQIILYNLFFPVLVT